MKSGICIANHGRIPEECTIAIMIDGRRVEFWARALADVLNSSLWWNVESLGPGPSIEERCCVGGPRSYLGRTMEHVRR